MISVQNNPSLLVLTFKAFDVVDIGLLIKRLTILRLPGVVVRLIKSWLRELTVKVFFTFPRIFFAYSSLFSMRGSPTYIINVVLVTVLVVLVKYGLPSVNQLSGEIKLVEAWKSINETSYPFQLEECNPNRVDCTRAVRTTTTKKWKDTAITKAARESIGIDCAKLWNIAPISVITAPTLVSAKREIKMFCKSLEI